MTYTIEKVTTLIGARRFGASDAKIGFVLTDSRSLCFPEETLFFALKSGRNDGHYYIPELYRRGVRNFVVTEVPADYATEYAEANFLKVVNSLEALQRLAERHRDEFNIPIVGIPGSNGKTMVSQPGEMLALRDIIQPTIAVLTNLGDAHQENFISKEMKCKEKLILFHDAKTVVYNGDDPIVNGCVNELEDFKGERLFWWLKDKRAPFFIKSIEKKETATTVTYIYKGNESWYSLPFIDDASVTNSFACAAVALTLGVGGDVLDERMQQLEPIAMRLEVKQGQHGCTLINDSYNSDINSLDIALDFMNRRPDHQGRRHTLILSDIYQSGMTTDELYQEGGMLCQQRGVEKFIGVGKDLQSHAYCIGVKAKYFFESVEELIDSDVFKQLHDEVILIKGARRFGFDQLTELLVQKVHETTLEVNLNAVVKNLNHYRSFMKSHTKLVCMIKADAYGAGSVEIAKTLQDHRVDYLAVAVADEGVTLRKNGITSNIMIMNPEMTAFKTMFDYDRYASSWL